MAKELEAHLKEMRWRLKHVLIVLVILTGLSFYFSADVLTFLKGDLNVSLHALVVYEVLYTRIMISVLMGFFLSLPVFMYHFLKFVKPGLRDSEYRVLRNYMPFSIMLFLAGASFAYQVIVKSSLSFFKSTSATSQVQSVWGLQSTLGFAVKLSAFTGVMFQLPIAALVLAKAGLLDREMMIRYRTYFLVSVLLLAAVATPPDVVTQVLLTLPVVGLYQLSIWLVSRVNSES